MWGFGLEHEVRYGFRKKIEPSLFLLKKYLMDFKKDKKLKNVNVPRNRDKLLNIINKNFSDDEINNSRLLFDSYEVENINKVFSIKLNELGDVDLKSVFYLLEKVTILLGAQTISIVDEILNQNIIAHFSNTEPKKKDEIFKKMSNYKDDIDTVKKMLIKKKIYNKNNSSFVTKTFDFNGKLGKLKFFKDVKLKGNQKEIYEVFLQYNFYRFYSYLFFNTNFNMYLRSFDNDIENLLIKMNEEYGSFWDFKFNDFSTNEKDIKIFIKEMKSYYLNKVSKLLSNLDNNKKYLFPVIKGTQMSYKVILNQEKIVLDLFKDIYGKNELFFHNQEYDLFSKNEILEQINYLLDVYVYMGNKNINFSNLSMEDVMKNKLDIKLDYPIKYLIDMYYNDGYESDWSQPFLPKLLEFKSLHYKNAQIEDIIREVNTYQKIVLDILNNYYKNTEHDFGEITIMKRGGDKNIIFLNADGFGNIIHKLDYFGSYHLWLTMPSKGLKNFADEHAELAKLLQWCEPLFFVFNVNNIYDGVGSYRFLLNKWGGYGTSNPNLLKEKNDVFDICEYYDGRDENKLMENLKNGNIVLNCFNTQLYNSKGKKIFNRNGLAYRLPTVPQFNSNNKKKNKEKLRTYLDILWEKANYKPDIRLGADIRTGDNCESLCWNNNFENKLRKGWDEVNIKKRDQKIYRYYYNKKTGKLVGDKPVENSGKKNGRTGFEFRVFDNVDTSFMYDVMFFAVLLYMVVLDRKKKKDIPLVINSKCWNETIANCIMKGANGFKVKKEYCKKLCELVDVPFKNKDKIIDLFQYLIDELHKKYKNKSLFKKMVKNHNLNIIIPNINLIYLQQNKQRVREEYLI